MSGAHPVAVLGGSGLLGSAVCRRFADAGRPVRAVSRSGWGVPGGGVHGVRADVTRRAELEAALIGAHTVVVAVSHRAAGAQGWRVDGTGPERGVYVDVCEHLAYWAGRQRRPVVLLHAGSSSQSGGSPTTAYDALKSRGEALVLGASSGGVDAVGLRLSTLYGQRPGTPDTGVVATMIRTALRGEPLSVWADGAMTRDLLWADDAAEAFLAAAAHAGALAGRPWTVGHGRAHAVADIAATVAREVAAATGRTPVPVRRTDPPPWATGHDLTGHVADPADFVRATGWRPRTTWHDGVRRLVDVLAARTLPGAPAPDAVPVPLPLPLPPAPAPAPAP
ncbi:NAD(P)-dependent oxidoreductase [uncultured Cellulomonas sp.]|uniref:NAD-dependent epimerase/dehydratase family protein n=1 Tax=uncultured Cellulomonas sp. TaxID=189682 RepID=UPI002621FFC3|nr:NAD(P)-dependent oxidoreductase [uncultured Cellulomonas sp.]